MRMRNKDGRYTGTGITLAFNDKEDTYKNKMVRKVHFPSDHVVGLEREDTLHGECRTVGWLTQEEITRLYG
jgi:hypothetical protein